MGLYRKVIQISAMDSPNVLEGIRRIREGTYPPSELLVRTSERPGFFSPGEYRDLKGRWDIFPAQHKLQPPVRTLIPGVVSFDNYLRRIIDWDPVVREARLFGRFYEGAEILLYPPAWLDRAEQIAESLPKRRQGSCMGIDAAEGGDNTCWAVVDALGLMDLLSLKTADTSDVPARTIAKGREWGIPPERWLFDRGGGGQQHADRLRAVGFDCQTVGFGEGATPPIKHGLTTLKQHKEHHEVVYIYRNRRAELYGGLRLLLNPATNPRGFGLPREIIRRKRTDGGPSLRDQLAPLPLKYDQEGRMYLPPKNRKTGTKDKLNKQEDCLFDILGCSPDEADALVLSCFGFKQPKRAVATSLS